LVSKRCFISELSFPLNPSPLPKSTVEVQIEAVGKQHFKIGDFCGYWLGDKKSVWPNYLTFKNIYQVEQRKGGMRWFRVIEIGLKIRKEIHKWDFRCSVEPACGPGTPGGHPTYYLKIICTF
jgi:hypothetical protein